MQRSKEVLLKEANSADKDLKIMAANDLTHLMLSSGGSVCQQILQVLLSHLEEPSVDVQGNSVKCITLLTPRMDNSLLGSLIQVILNKDIKDIHVTLIKSVINQLGAQQHSMVATISLALECHINTMLQQNKQESLAILLEVFSLILSRFKQLFQEKNMLKEPFALGMRLLIFLDGDIKNMVSKLTVNSIQQLLETYSIGQQPLVEAIWTRLVRAEGKVLQMSILMGTALKRQKELRLTNQVIILDTLLRMLSQHLNAPDQQEPAFELIEQLVNCLFYLCMHSPQDFISPQKKQEIQHLVQTLLTYDPFESILYLKDKEFQEEEEEYDDYYADMEDDHTWRVRKAGLRMLLWSRNTPQFLDVLLQRIDEQNENVRKAAYEALIDHYERETGGEGALTVLERLYVYLEERGQDIQLLTIQVTLLGLLHRHDIQAFYYPRLVKQAQDRMSLNNQSSILLLLLNILIKYFQNLPSLDVLIHSALNHKFIKIQILGYKLMQQYAQFKANDIMVQKLAEKLGQKQDQDIYQQVLEVVKAVFKYSSDKVDISRLLEALQRVPMIDAVACINALQLHSPLKMDQNLVRLYRDRILEFLQQNSQCNVKSTLLEGLARTVHFAMDSFSQQDLDKVTVLIFSWENLTGLLDNVVSLLGVVVHSQLNIQGLMQRLNQSLQQSGLRSHNLQIVLLKQIQMGRLDSLLSSSQTYSSHGMAFYQACFVFNNSSQLQHTMNQIKQQQNLPYNLDVLLEVLNLSSLPALRDEKQPILCFSQCIDLAYLICSLFPQLDSPCKSVVVNISAQLVIYSDFQCFQQVCQLFSSHQHALLQVFCHLVVPLQQPYQYELHSKHYQHMQDIAFSLFCEPQCSSEVASILSRLAAFNPTVFPQVQQRLVQKQNVGVCLTVAEHQVCSQMSHTEQQNLLQTVLGQSSSFDMVQKIKMYRLLIKKQKQDNALFLRVVPLTLLAQNVAQDLCPREDLVKVLNLGPFKHTIDEGQELRSIAYQVLLAMASYQDLQDKDILQLLNQAVGQIMKEENEDLVVLGMEVLQRMMDNQMELVVANEAALVSFLENQVGRLRRQNNSGANLQRMVLQVVVGMQRLVKSVQMASLVDSISSSEPLHKIFLSLQ